jgi:hypothetical protein
MKNGKKETLLSDTIKVGDEIIQKRCPNAENTYRILEKCDRIRCVLTRDGYLPYYMLNKVYSLTKYLATQKEIVEWLK